MLIKLFIKLTIGISIIAALTKGDPLRIFDAIIPYEKLEKLTHEIILEPWPNPDIFQGEKSEFFD